jgi:hypothetical protein
MTPKSNDSAKEQQQPPQSRAESPRPAVIPRPQNRINPRTGRTMAFDGLDNSDLRMLLRLANEKVDQE